MLKPLQDLDEFTKGELNNKFAVAIKDITSNIYDPRTDAKKAREINIKIKFIPNELRTSADISAEVKTKLAPQKETFTSAYIGVDENGELMMVEQTEQIPGQVDMAGERQPEAQVFNFNPKSNDYL